MIILAVSLGFAAEGVSEFWRWYWLKKGNYSINGSAVFFLRPKMTRKKTPLSPID